MGGLPLPRYRLALLGRFELSGLSGPVDLRSKKLSSLLAYLACTAPAPQSREKLATLLWGSHFETQAQQNLRQALYRLRRTLGDDALSSDGDDIRLAPGVIDCDVARLEALIGDGSRASLAAAGDLYHGRLLSDVTIAEEAWADWVAGERQRLEGLALDALVRSGEIELAAGLADKALEAAHRALAINNLREDAHRLTIQALAAAGRQAEALKHYQDLTVLLKRELQTEPDALTKSLVAALGSTQKLMRSPAVRDPEPTVNAENPAAGGDEPSLAGTVRSGSLEQRQLTIMVCTMVGTNPRRASRDPEDIHDLIAAFHKRVADTVARFDGFVAQYLGNGVLVYFGYPTAREHDAEQAVRAGIAVLEAAGTLKAPSGMTLQASAGIDTGLVVVGDKSETGDARKPVAIGQTPYLAARLQAAAAPGEIVIAASTRRLVGSMFDCRALPAIEVKGLAEPVEAWQVLGEAPGVSRFEARRAGALTPLVGRQEEIDLMLRRWDQAKRGEGRIVLLSGEPGIGKSRIAESLLARLEGEPYARLRYFCSPHHTHSALYPFIAQLERAARFEPGSDSGAKLDRLEALLTPTTTSAARDVALIAELLGVPADGRYPALPVSPQQKREMTLTALLDQLDGAAAEGPVLIVFEDVHWIDPTSQDLLDRTVDRVANLPVLLVVTVRPELQPSWVGQPHVTMLPLSRLGRRDSASIIAGITKGKALPDAVVEQVLAHTDGVPLFIEELTSTLIESGLLRETTDSYVLDGPLPPLALPMTLQASLVARLDRLGPVKDVAQIGAAIGREYSHGLIAAVSDLAPKDLEAALARLMESGLVSRRGAPPDATYSFKHALVQDAAYATMLKSRRRQLHASIATVLVERFPAMAETLPEVVAHQFTEAGLAGEAISYWLKAGRLAYARAANREAVEFFERALHLLEALPEARERLEQAIDLRFDLRTSLLQLGEFERIVGYLREAEGLARTLDDQRRLGETSVYMCHNLWMTGHPTEAVAFGESAQAIAESLGDVPLLVTGNLYLGAACMWMGDYRRAEDLLLKVLRLLEGDQQLGLDRRSAERVRSYLTLTLAAQGKFEEGIAHGQEGIRLAEALDDPYSLTNVRLCLASLHITKGEISRAVDLLERGREPRRQWNLTVEVHTARLGYAYALSGRIAEGIPLMAQALSVSQAMRYGIVQPQFLMYLGEAYILADRLEDAHECAGRALTVARECGQRGHEAMALRLLGEVNARRDLPEHAEGHYRDALALAEEFGMRPLVAHCHLGLGKLYRRTGERDRARDQLAAATTMYREMDMRFRLDEAESEMRRLP
ncbi:MAG: AAA family ATPase [Proteobacteria bacterium]|nr:AAA family ATPase [Pseudomonadota bacterium]MBI3499946.1 AAA family ATPase [Pseudomonadota bacterium]